MKLVLSIVSDEDAGKLVDALVARDFRATRYRGAGGFLKAENSTIMSGVDDDQVDAYIDVVHSLCKARTELHHRLPPFKPVEVRRGGAVVMVLPIARFERV